MPDDYYLRHADAYDRSSEGLPGDVEFYRDLAVASGGPVVELGVGTARVAIPIAEAGIEVIGIDNAAPMLAIAEEKARSAGVAGRMRLIEGSMSTFTVEEPVPLVIIPYRSFLHNLETEEQLATLAACHRALLPGGLLALNVFNPDLRVLEGWNGLTSDDWRADGHPAAPAPRIVRSTLRVRDGAGVRRSARIEMRYVGCEEMRDLLGQTGFTVEALYGDFMRAPFVASSTEMVWVARRR